ncbi:MAG: hypothetical protein WCA92_13730 [Terriglobales bacterium]|jgi:hypothetical protein
MKAEQVNFDFPNVDSQNIDSANVDLPNMDSPNTDWPSTDWASLGRTAADRTDDDRTLNIQSSNNLSFIIEPSGEIVPAAPEEEVFSPQQIRDYVAGPPELVCQTHDGFFLFRNKEGKARGLPPNELATSMYLRPFWQEGLLGRIFVAHPAHIDDFWKKKRRRGDRFPNF